jgi:DNA-binding transcriptional ArsR family regulator
VRVTGALRERILSCLADDESRRILASVVERPKAPSEIEHDIGLTQTTLYRKISLLKACGLLMVHKYNISPDGKKETIYACTFDEIRLRPSADGFEIEIVETAESLERRWFELFFARSSVSPPEPSSGSS